MKDAVEINNVLLVTSRFVITKKEIAEIDRGKERKKRELKRPASARGH